MSDWTFPISDDEIRTLNAARTVLDEIARRESSTWDLLPADAARVGRIHLAAEVASTHIFNALNITSNYGRRGMPYEQLHNASKWESDARSPSLPDVGGLPISDPRVDVLREEGSL